MDLQFSKYLKDSKSRNATPISALQSKEARLLVDERMSHEISKPEKVSEIRDIVIHGYKSNITIRLYKPKGKPPFNIMLFFHGGGWVLGNINNYDSLCTQMSNLSSCVIISVGYHLAPEHKFPEPVEDCYCAFTWILENIKKYDCDPSHLAICGDSAGGNLAAVVANMAKDRGILSIKYLLLMYPLVDISNFNYDSYKLFGTGFGLSKEDIVWCAKQYLNNEDERFSPYVSPLLTKDLSNLPHTYIITAGFDVLKDQGYIYAVKLKEAGIPVTVKCYENFIHGFFTMDAVSDLVRPAIIKTSKIIKKVFS